MAAVRAVLEASALVDGFVYVNREAAFDEFQQHYADTAEILDLVQAENLPTSFRLYLTTSDPEALAPLADEVGQWSGVRSVDRLDDYLGGAWREFGRYEWEEAGARVTVDGPRTEAEALIPLLRLVPGDGLPEVKLDEVPEGLSVLSGPNRFPPGERLSLTVVGADGEAFAELATDNRPFFILGDGGADVVSVNGQEGYLLSDSGLHRLSWPAPGGRWAQLRTRGLDREATVALAEGVLFVNEETWTAAVPEPSAYLPESTVEIPTVETTVVVPAD